MAKRRRTPTPSKRPVARKATTRVREYPITDQSSPADGPAKPMASRVKSLPGTPAQDIGIPAKQIEMTRKYCEEDATLLEKGERTEETTEAAFALWMGYPHLLELIGHNIKIVGPMPAHYTLDRPESSWGAYYALNAAHWWATQFLMAEAEKCGLDPHPLFECGNLIRELYAREPWRYYAGRGDYWPECMGEARYTLLAGQQDAIRAGEAVYVRLAVKLSVADGPNLLSPPESRCAPMSQTEIARRLLNREKARPREALGIMQRHGLRHEGGNKWTIRLAPDLGMETLKRLQGKD